jgi:cytoskeleton protein RodZ
MVKSLQEHAVVNNMEEALDLRSLRETRGLTLDDISQATKVSVKNLAAMENGDFHLLPPPVYTKAYFKSYARLLGIDEKLISARYEKNLAVSTQAVEEEIEEIPEKDSFFSQKIIINAATVLVLCVLGFLSYWYFNSPADDVALDSPLTMNSKDKPVIDAKNSTVSAQPIIEVPVGVGSGTEDKSLQTGGIPASAVSTPDLVNSEETKDDVTKQPIVKSLTLIIIAREKTWLRITEDQKEAYELLMAPGERIERSALQYEIDIGNAGGVSVQFQKKIMNALGKSGEVVHLRLP